MLELDEHFYLHRLADEYINYNGYNGWWIFIFFPQI
jgi:hypothetical protein